MQKNLIFNFLYITMWVIGSAPKIPEADGNVRYVGMWTSRKNRHEKLFAYLRLKHLVLGLIYNMWWLFRDY